MQYLKLTDDKWVEVDEERDIARVVKKSTLIEERARAEYNIQELTKMVGELGDKVATSDKLDVKQAAAVSLYNSSLGLDRYQKELADFVDQKKKLDTILKAL